MKRTKLQAMVRTAIQPQHQISTEGFLGGAIDKIKAVLTGRKQILNEKKDLSYGSFNTSVVDRLKETVLDEKWLESAKFADKAIKADWAVPGLDFKQMFNPEQPLKHLTTVHNEYKALDKHIADALKKDRSTVFRIYNAMFKELAKHYEDDDFDFGAITLKYDVQVDKIPHLQQAIASKAIHLLGNVEVSAKKSESGYSYDRKILNSKVSEIPTLTKEQAVELAKFLLTVLDASNSGSHVEYVYSNYDDWDTMGCNADLSVSAYAVMENEELAYAVEHSLVWKRFSAPDVIEASFAADLEAAQVAFILNCMRWLNESVK